MLQTKTKTTFTVPVVVSVPDDQIESLIITGIEQGINYWCRKMKTHRPPGEGASLPYHQVPLVEGGSLHFFVDGAEEIDDEPPVDGYLMDFQHIQNGLNLMAARSPNHFANIMEDNTDCITGDVFIQYCLFGEIIFG